MLQKPRLLTVTFFNLKELTTSVVQGLMIAGGSLLIYQYAVQQGFNESITRTMVFIVLISANISLTLVNRSFYFSILSTMKYKNNLVLLIIGVTLVVTFLLLYVNPITLFFRFEHLNILQVGVSLVTGFLSVIWYEAVKWRKRGRMKS